MIGLLADVFLYRALLLDLLASVVLEVLFAFRL